MIMAFGKTVRAGLTGLLLLSAALAQTTKSGTIAASETWSGNLTVTGNVTITGGTVTISPGAVIQINDGFGITVETNGAVQAIGTEASPILFTTSNATPAKGDWGEIRLNHNAKKSAFTHCVMEYGNRGLSLFNSGPDASYCTIRQMDQEGIFADSCGAVTFQIDHCQIRDCMYGIFFIVVGNGTISHTSISQVACGIIMAGGGSDRLAIDHCTVAGVDSRLDPNPRWWTGYGIYCCNNSAATLTMNNTVVSMLTPAPYRQYCFFGSDGVFTVTRDYNCFFGGLGAVSGAGATLGSHDLTSDPVFVDAATGDVRLRTGSPCINTASDGTHRGSWQGTPIDESARYRGRVTRQGTGSGVGGVLVVIKGTTNQTNTDDQGYFALYPQTRMIEPYRRWDLPPAPGLYYDQPTGRFVLTDPGMGGFHVYDTQGREAGARQNDPRYYALHRGLPTGMYLITAGLGDLRYTGRALLVNGRVCGLEGLAPRGRDLSGPAAKAAATGVLVFSKRGYDGREVTCTEGDQNIQVALVYNGQDYFFSDFTDLTVVGMYVDNYMWKVSTSTGTGGNLFTLANISLSATHAGDAGTGFISLKVPANKLEGAELICTEEMQYGYYEARLKCSNVWGACNAFFWINQSTAEEIDCEFLTPDFYNTPGTGIERCQLHPGNYGGPTNLPFNPSEGFHRIGYLLQPGRLDWTADGQIIRTITVADQVPDHPGRMFFNNWTGNPNWGGGPPAADNIMVVDWCRFHPGATSIVPVP